MPKTMKRSKNTVKTRKHKEKCCKATMHGLQKWYVEEFEKLGWMVLAKSRGMDEKIKYYKYTLGHLDTAIKQKIAKIHDQDDKRDLEIMLHNLTILINHVDKDFP